jgi:hypothetical protein
MKDLEQELKCLNRKIIAQRAVVTELKEKFYKESYSKQVDKELWDAQGELNRLRDEHDAVYQKLWQKRRRQLGVMQSYAL